MPPEADITLDFDGPFAWQIDAECPSVLEDARGAASGIYLWTNNPARDRRVYYVGETGTSFASRLGEHLRLQLGGAYHVYEPRDFAAGVKTELWPGAFGPRRVRELGRLAAMLPELAVPMVAFVRNMRFYLASLDVPPRVRQRAEAALADGIRAMGDHLQDDGIRYRRRRPDELALQIRVRVPGEVRGVPEWLTG